jgi:pre-mRNA-splicing factor CWC26
MSMQAYLAQKYMTGPKADAILARTAPKKKKKRKAELSHSASGSGSAMIVDTDGGWGDEGKDDGGDDLAEAVIEQDRGFKKRRVEGSSNWETVQPGTKEESPPADEQPTVVEDTSSTPFVGGLLTSDQLRKALPQSKGQTTEPTQEEIDAARETIYRDAQGRIIDTKAAKADAARKKREKEEREAQKMEWGKGLVQREESEKRRLELEKQRTQGFARYADDKDLNEDMKAQERWNDPAATFLTVSCQPWTSNVSAQYSLIFAEENGQRAAQTAIFRTPTSTKSFRYKTRV